jgi:monothiol glutaredoxin
LTQQVKFLHTQRVFFQNETHNDFKPKKKLTDDEILKQKLNELQTTIDSDVKSNPVVLYMKGTPQTPECGFSRAVVQVLEQYGYNYKTFNMNKDVLMKEALKIYSDWPTIPQLYVKGELIGGCDIVVGHHRDGELESILSGSGAEKKNN